MAAPKKYPDELKPRAVRLYRDSDPKPTIRKFAAQLGVDHEALRNWIRQDQAHAGQRQDVRRPMWWPRTEELRKRVAELEQVNAVLRYASAYFASHLGQTGGDSVVCESASAAPGRARIAGAGVASSTFDEWPAQARNPSQRRLAYCGCWPRSSISTLAWAAPTDPRACTRC
ncbi:transposase [Nocardia takedensis]